MKGPIGGGVALAILAAVGAGAPAAAEEPGASVVEEILGVLEQRGLIEREEHDRLVARYHESEARQASRLPRIRLSGDLRLRGEGFWYDEDETGDDPSNRYRGRYRLRVAADADVNDWVAAHLRLASGEDDLRSTNTSFGRPGPDFDPDPIFIDRAWVELRAPEGRLPAAGTASLDVGKVPNPFVWKVTRDVLLWDNDIHPEGVGLRLAGEAAPGVSLFANGGYLILDENGSSTDPHLIGAQLGAAWEAATELELGARASWYGFRSVDDDFVERGVDGSGGSTSAGGNIPDGLVSDGDRLDVAELGAYVAWAGIERWPLRLFGHLSRNLSAQDSELFPAAGEEAWAWLAGLEAGDKKELVQLGIAYSWIEANAFPSQFVDSDLFDGVTNRKGFAFWFVRQLVRNTDLAVTLFLSDAIEDALPDFEESVAGSDRIRLQTDLQIAF
jgi:hypothetical protein